MESRIDNHLAYLRKQRGLAASELARRVGVSRQSIYAIEAGDFVPNTEVALRLARELEVKVEELFALPTEGARGPTTFESEVIGNRAARKGQAVRVGRVGKRLVCIPVQAAPYYLPEADGILTGKGEVAFFGDAEDCERRLVVAGCDPAMGLLASMVERDSGVELVSAPAASKLALRWLVEGKVHVAGSHLADAATGEFNLPYLRHEFPDEDFVVVTFANWEEGWVTAAGNPKEIRGAGDLTRRGVRLANRELGSGSRALLDRLLKEAGIENKKVKGYESVSHGHLAAAWAVLSGEADCCLATRAAAQTFGLGFVPVETERYDFVMRRGSLQTAGTQALLEVLQKASLRRKLEGLAGYDTRETGAIRA